MVYPWCYFLLLFTKRWLVTAMHILYSVPKPRAVRCVNVEMTMYTSWLLREFNDTLSKLQILEGGFPDSTVRYVPTGQDMLKSSGVNHCPSLIMSCTHQVSLERPKTAQIIDQGPIESQ